MMAFGWAGVDSRIALIRGEETCPWQDVKASHPYAGALLQAQRAGCLVPQGGRMRPEDPISREELGLFLEKKLGRPVEIPQGTMTHGALFQLAAPLLAEQ